MRLQPTKTKTLIGSYRHDRLIVIQSNTVLHQAKAVEFGALKANVEQREDKLVCKTTFFVYLFLITFLCIYSLKFDIDYMELTTRKVIGMLCILLPK